MNHRISYPLFLLQLVHLLVVEIVQIVEVKLRRGKPHRGGAENQDVLMDTEKPQVLDSRFPLFVFKLDPGLYRAVLRIELEGPAKPIAGKKK